MLRKSRMDNAKQVKSSFGRRSVGKKASSEDVSEDEDDEESSV